MEYFEKIDTEEKAYYLGLIYADGAIVLGGNYGGKNRAPRLSIMLQEQDGYILENLAKELNAKVIRKHSPSQIKKGEQANSVVNKSGHRLVHHLCKYGIGPNKSSVGMTFPDIPEDMKRHFVRGFFDGDGCISVDFPKSSYIRKSDGLSSRKPVRGRITFVSTDLKFLTEVCKCINPSKFYCKSKIRRLVIHSLSIERQDDVIKAFHYMYDNSTIFLTRKRDKFNTLISSQAKGKLLEGSETT